MASFTLVPFWDYRGTPAFGLFADGAYAKPYAAGGSSCPASPGTGTTDRCVYLTWPFAGSAYQQDRGLVLTYSWQGSLLLKKRDVSGLTYARNRMYDPGTGRFTQEDPIGLAGGLNAYGFAGGDPVNYADPAGLCPIGSDKFANTACPHHAENFQSWYSRQGLQDAGLFDPTILLSGGISAGIRFLGARMLGQAAVVATVEETAATRLAANKEAGDLFRDEIAEIFRKAGYYVRLEVTKQTMFGRRVIDIEISRGGVILGGIETKWGLARYNASQQAKDAYLRLFKDYIVQVVRPQ